MDNSTAVYLRFSPRPNAEESRSLEVQKSRCLAYCSMHNLDPKFIIEDPEISARTSTLGQREGGRKMLDLIDRSEVSHVVVMKLDRLFRSIDGRLIMDQWHKKGVTLHLADQSRCSINCSTALGRYITTILIATAELEPAMIAERTSVAMKNHQENGFLMSSRPPYGKKIVEVFVENELVRKIVDDDYEQGAIELIKTMRSEGASLGKICRELTRLEIQPRERRWHKSTVVSILKRNCG
ncbi:recombinase family protein [Candidatus Kaiserbacteria bacterium]|nr:recombinase family protein [Candidatus Kaiserbacteria bacterium]